MAQKTQMKPVPPGSLEVGKTYYATNLGGGRRRKRRFESTRPTHWTTRQWQAHITANPLPDGPASAFSPNQRFVVTIAKNEPVETGEKRKRGQMARFEYPHDITLKDIKLIVGKGEGKGSVLESYEPSTFTPLWNNMLEPADVPKFYERKAAGLMMKKAFSEKKILYPTHGVVTHAMGYGGRRKAKRRRRTRGRRRKGKRTRRLRRRKKRRTRR